MNMKLHKKFVIWIGIPVALVAIIVTVLVVFSDLRIELKIHFNQPNPMTRQYTTEEWMAMITQSQHQTTAIWEGVRAGYIKKDGAGSGGGLLHFLDTPAHVLEFQISDLLDKDPMMFSSALVSNDKRVLQTGLDIYNRFSRHDLSDKQNQKLTDAYRALLKHKDTALRAYAIYKLGARRELTVTDVDKGLNDETGDVRYVTSFWIHTMFENPPVYNADGKIYKGQAARGDQFVEMKRKLAPILLDRLNDPRLSTRDAMARSFCLMLQRHEYTGTGVRHQLPGYFPKKIDWRRETWHKCEETKKLWTEWWAKRGEEALAYAHPPQN